MLIEANKTFIGKKCGRKRRHGYQSFPQNDVKNESKFIDDLGADSLDTVELVMALEEEFETEIPDEEAEKITSVQEAIDYINANQ